jgi:polyhydroxyalkanoate synthesis regulator phasin
MTEQEGGTRRPNPGDTVRDGIRSGIGMLIAMKEALEETIADLRDRGELTPERAKETIKTTMNRAQEKAEAFVADTRERLDFVPRKEFDELRAEVERLRAKLADRLGQGDAAAADVSVDGD